MSTTAMSVLGTEPNMRPRAYQLEMLEASLKENVIVAMDTGSGKTQIAVLRIAKELEVCPAAKMIWFLAPTVALCEQQYKVLSLQLPSVRIRLLVGRDNIDRWKSQDIWNAALYDVRVVVSTHAVLLDALIHGFVVMARLALLIFDEAHHCVRKHPANRIMKAFYYSQKGELGSTSRPKILGLTASPIVRTKPKELQVIEANLDSITKTPRIYRDELVSHIHIPKLLNVSYIQEHLGSQALPFIFVSLLRHVGDAESQWKKVSFHLLSTEEITKLSASIFTRSKWSTSAQEQLKKLCARAKHVQQELGPWASNHYITASIARTTLSMHLQQNTRLFDKDEEKIYILNTLGQIQVADSESTLSLQEPISISKKCTALVELLKNRYDKNFRGVIFVEQRVTAAVLCHLLSEHPETKSLFTCGKFVGTSTDERRRTELGDLPDQCDQMNTLKDFREGNKNLIIATSALEEGIDISACNVVVCFNKPPNLKSFIQRRGRARHEKSIFVLFSASDDDSDLGACWGKLESEMVMEYMRESRQKHGITIDEMSNDIRVYRVDSTGAQLHLESAIGHLHHFCATLPAYDYVDHRPLFTFEAEETTGLIRGLVTLPSSVHHSVRRALSLHVWKREHTAAKDAAFEACVALHKAGLLNDHLLPLRLEDSFDDEEESTKDFSSMVGIQQQYDPWFDVGKKRGVADNCYLKMVKVRVSGEEVLSTKLILPIHTRLLPWSPLLFKDNAHYEICMEDSKKATKEDLVSLDLFQTATRLLLRPVCGSWMDGYQSSFVALFAPPMAQQELRAWIQNYSNDSGQEIPRHRTSSIASSVPTAIFQKTEITNVTRLLYSPNRFALFAPHILHILETLLIGEKMAERIHPDVHFERVDLVFAAISSPSSSGLSNNNRLAFLGDTVLDFLITVQLFAMHRNWHEGYLSAKKKLIISNTHLSGMALQTGLDRFIITKPFSERTWKFPTISAIHSKDLRETRKISEKALADVVEALIGAAYLEGHFEKALQCARIFLPEFTTHHARFPDFSLIPADNEEQTPGIPHFGLLEKLIGYKFRNKAHSAEAMTHPSCEQDLAADSYGRLAFLGSSILSMVIIQFLCDGKKAIPSNQLNLLRASTINKDFLAFVCLDTSLDVDYADVQQYSHQFHKVWRRRSVSLWAFIRHAHSDIASEREEFLTKHSQTCRRIREALDYSTTYPWRDLAKLEAKGYYSEIVRSLFGAVYIDSNGDMQQCSQLAEKLNILPRLRRLMQDNVDVIHPKTKLGELTGGQKVAYTLETLSANIHRCTVRVDGQQIGEAQNGSCKQEVVIRAAEHTVTILRITRMSSTIKTLTG